MGEITFAAGWDTSISRKMAFPSFVRMMPAWHQVLSEIHEAEQLFMHDFVQIVDFTNGRDNADVCLSGTLC